MLWKVRTAVNEDGNDAKWIWSHVIYCIWLKMAMEDFGFAGDRFVFKPCQSYLRDCIILQNGWKLDIQM